MTFRPHGSPSFTKIRRLDPLMTLAVLACLSIGPGCSDPLEDLAAKRPNVLLISVDTLRADHLGCYGGAKAETPAMDRLAREGTLMRRAYTPCPVTLPAHTSLLTGAYPPFHGVRNNGIFRADEGLRLAAELFKARGYATGAVVGAYVLDRQYGLAQGFDVYDDDMGSGEGEATSFFFPERRADAVTSSAYELVKKLRRKGNTDPFFLWVHYFDPHARYDAPPPFSERYADDPYAGEVAYTDEQLGRLLNLLAMKGWLENTLVVLTADHGEGLMEHDEKSHGVFCYDATLKVPLIFHAPGIIPENRIIENPVSLVDVLPTLAELAGLEAPADGQFQGRSLAPLLRGETPAARDPIYFETLLPYFDFGWSGLAGFLEGHRKFISAPKSELYDTGRDSKELHNLLSENPDVAKGLAETLSRMQERLEAAGRIGDADGGREGGPGGGSAAGPDADAAARLAALGYSSGAVHTVVGDSVFMGPDPKDRIWVQTALYDAAALFQQGKTGDAVAALEALLVREPRNPNLLFFLGVMCAGMGRLDDAERHYVKLLEVQPGLEKALINLGIVLNRQGRPDAAYARFEAAARANPEHADARYNMARILMGQDEMERAEALLKEVIALDPAHASALNNLGSVRAERGDMKGAAKAFERAFLADPDLASAFLNAGRCHFLLGHPRKALHLLEEAERKGATVDSPLLEEVRKQVRQKGKRQQ